MPAQSITSLDTQISSLTSDITALNNQIATKQTVKDTQASIIPGLLAAYNLRRAKYEYVKAKAQKAGYGNKNKDKQCYDNAYLFPTSGACYNRTHWDQQWNYFLSEAQKKADQLAAQRSTVDASAKELSDLKSVRDDKVIERDLAIAAKGALVKSESDAAASIAAGEAMNNPEIVNATLAAETARKEAELTSNRKLFIYGMATLAFVVVAIVIVKAMK